MASFLSTLFGGGAEREAAERNRALAAQYQTDAQGYLTRGYDTGVGNLNRAIGAYDPLASLAGQYRQGSNTYFDALGLQGPEGNARATSAFQAGPGYQFAQQQGLDAIDRRRAIGGMYASGNADIDTLKFSQGLADQEYGSWLSRLQGLDQNALAATGATAAGQAAGYGNLSNLAQLYAQNQTGVAGTGLSAGTSANTLQAQGEASGARNMLGAGLGLASLFTGGGLGNSLANAGGRAPGYAPSGLMRLFG